MRRAGGWFLGLVAVAAMAGGGWIAFRPILNREVLWIEVERGLRDPSNNALISGMEFALKETGHRAGRYRLELLGPKPGVDDAPTFRIELGGDSVIRATTPHSGFSIAVPDTPVELQVQPTLQALGSAAGAWVAGSGAKRVTLVFERDRGPVEQIADEFCKSAMHIVQDFETRFDRSGEQDATLDRILKSDPDLVFFSGEAVPYGRAFELFDGLRKRGYPGRMVMADAEPEVSYLAVPTKVVEGTFLVSTLGPPSREFAAKYEPDTGRFAGPHAWPGYLLMRAMTQVVDRAKSKDEPELRRALLLDPPARRPCALYVHKGGKFEFVQDLKELDD